MTTANNRSHEIQVAPSILAADFLHLADAVREAEDAGVTRLHLDVMDGRFVPNISFGQPVVRAIRSSTSLLLEAHLMIVEPERYVPDFAAAGADLITIHQEVSPHLYRSLELIRSLGKRAGVAINPATPVEAIEEILGLADLILVMTVSPGFGGQEFIEAMLPKIRRVRAAIDHRRLATELEVDGGIDEETAGEVVSAGARVLVAGTAVYRSRRGVKGAVAAIERAARDAHLPE